MVRRLIGSLAVLLLWFNETNSLEQSLNGDWLVRDSSGTYNNLNATVPGGIYSDLMNNDVINDVFYGYNDVETRWVSKSNWTYYRNFTVDEDLLSNANINIVFDGLDTFATIVINDVVLGTSRNMFVRYIYNIKDVLQEGSNTIEVQFQSPLEVALKLAVEQNKSYVVPPECFDPAYHGECHANMVRKMQASFSWDWGPAFPSMGIWKNVYIEAYNSSLIRNVILDVEEVSDNDTWTLIMRTEFASNVAEIVSGTLTGRLLLGGGNTFTEYKIINITQTNEYNEFWESLIISIPKNNINLWWPNGYGVQQLYTVEISYQDESLTETSQWTSRIGFRTVELVQEEATRGLTFYFKVNGVPIFMKGSNEIPVDILPERADNPEVIRRILTDARDTHMNMIRVWGGGMYESDNFYDTADELGILVWQDFMFACAMYPVNEEFLSNVIEEVRYQTKRLKRHTSIALFAGNNENEAALSQNWYGTKDNFARYKDDYVKLYVDTVRQEYKRLGNDKWIFLSSSPTNAKESETEGYVALDPGSSVYGDVHFYNYILSGLNPMIYPTPRFASEYGYQSLPSISTWLTATNSTAVLDIRSEFMDHRQHHPGGNAQLKLLIDFELQLPSESSANYWRTFIYFSQIIHAISVKIETEHYRSCRSFTSERGEGLTMGALFWQLNDVWVAPTWSGIDFTGKWKMMQYFAQDFFAPVIVTGAIDAQRQLQLYVVSDILSPIENATFVLSIYNWTSLEPLSTTEQQIDVPPSASTIIDTLPVDQVLSEAGCGEPNVAKYSCFLTFVLKRSDLVIAPTNFVFPASLKDTRIQQATVKIDSVTKVSDENSFEIVLTTDSVAIFVFLDAGAIKGRFSDNGFLLLTEQRTVYFDAVEETSVDELTDVLTVTNYRDPENF